MFRIFLILVWILPGLAHSYGSKNRRCRGMLRHERQFRFLRSGRRLETSIRKYLRALRKCRYLRRHERERVVVYDYRGCKLVAIRQWSRTSAASLIKPFVMLGVYRKSKRARRRLRRFPRDLQDAIDDMMQVSNNRATNYLIREYLGRGHKRRGFRYLNRMLRRYRWRRTRFVELIPKGGRTYRNYTSARDLNSFLFLMYRKRLVSSAISKRMLRVMLPSRDNRGKTLYLKDKYSVRAGTKTGYTRRTNGVMGVFLGGRGVRRVYNLVAILTRPYRRRGERRWRIVSSAVLQRISEMTYEYYRRGYDRKEIRRYKKTRRCRR